MRINKFIALNSQYSRRQVDQLIQEGRIFLNNQKVKELGTIINPENDIIKVDEQIIENQKEEKIYLALNKPKNYITTRQDEHNRPTVMDLVPKIPNLKPVGRLDSESEGLLLLSNDGDFINHHTHPKFECQKEYWVKINGEIQPETIEKLENGIVIEGKKTAQAHISVIERAKNQSIVRIKIHEGRNRQIRKMFAKVKHPVKYLKRIAIGKIQLGNLQIGAYRQLTKSEIND